MIIGVDVSTVLLSLERAAGLPPANAVAGSPPRVLVESIRVCAQLENALAARRVVLTNALTQHPWTLDGQDGVPSRELMSGYDVAVGEIAALLALTLRGARMAVDHAQALTGELPATTAVTLTGELDQARARVMLEELSPGEHDGTAMVPPEVRAETEEAVLPKAPELTRPELRARIRHEIARRLPEVATAAAEARRPRRCVRIDPMPGGTAFLEAVLPADAGVLADGTLDAMARAIEHLPSGERPSGPARRSGQSDGSWRDELHQWARSEALAAIFRSVADGRPLPVVELDGVVPVPDLGPGGADGPVDGEQSGGDAHGAGARDAGPARVVAWWLPPQLPARQGHTPHLNITVGLATLLGRSDEPAELAGHGAISAGFARQLAAQMMSESEELQARLGREVHRVWAERRFGRCAGSGERARKAVGVTVVGPAFTILGVDGAGNCAHVGTRTSYRPSRRLKDRAAARHRRCRAPGCRRPAEQCDYDHLRPHAEGGPTCEHNLFPLCRFHHRLKTHARWQARPAPSDVGRPPGTLEWLTRYGTRRYSEPEPLPG